MKLHCSSKTIFTFCALLLFVQGFSQTNFSSGSLKEALQKAANEGKFVLIQFEAADCERCNDVANKGFENKELAEKLEQTFICLKINANHPDRTEIASTYKLNEKAFGTLFIDNNGSLLHSYLKTTTFSKDYIKQIDIAFSKAGEVLQIEPLEKEYKNGNKAFGFLEILMEKRKALYHPTDALLEEYIDALPPDSLKSIRTLAFIAKMAPMLDSKADKALKADRNLFNRAWYSMSLPVRISINNAVIRKGMEKAIREKDEKLALRTASFAQGTNTNPQAGTKAYDMNMLRFYDETKDTMNYFRKSIAYYERYFLSVSPDSIKKTDSINLRRMLDKAKKDTVIKEDGKMKMTASVIYKPIVQQFSRELNNGAYNFYLRTNNPYLLSIATEWSKRALEFYVGPEVLDTYAKLLYKQNQKTAAIEEMIKAIEQQKKRGFPTATYAATLEKMKANAQLTD